MERYDLIVIGAGPAGLSAGIEAAKHGMKVMIFDENHKPGGQLFKQIHKFFGSKEHKAKIRGFNIGTELLKDAEEVGVQVKLDATVTGITMLSEEESVEELARMLGGIEITEAVRNNAIEMKKMAKNQM